MVGILIGDTALWAQTAQYPVALPVTYAWAKLELALEKAVYYNPQPRPSKARERTKREYSAVGQEGLKQ